MSDQTEKAGTLRILSKTDRVPSSGEAIFYRYAIEGLPIKGGDQWDRFIYNAKYNGQKYQKIWIDVEAKVLLGKRDDLVPWERLVIFASVERVHL